MKTGKADVVVSNGRLLTMDPCCPRATALAVRGNRIAAVGSQVDLEGLVGPSTTVIDAEGRSVIPGLIDAHNHMLGYGLAKLAVNCKHPVVGSISDIQHALRARARSTSPGEWIVGRGYNQNRLAEGRHPTRDDLDVVTTAHPVAITRTCGHIAVANTRALQLAGIDDATPNPEGGVIQRDSHGRATGVLFEAAQAMLHAARSVSVDELVEALATASSEYLSWGITSIHEASGGSAQQVRALCEAATSGRNQVRVYAMLRHAARAERSGVLSPGAAVLAAGLIPGFGDERLRLGPTKLMLDGSSSGPTAATREPYVSQPDFSGIMYHSQDEVDWAVWEVHSSGGQVTAHAVGDAAIEQFVSAVEKAQSRLPRPGARHRIEHCAILPPDLLKRVREQGLVPVSHPVWLWEFGDGYLRDYGPERVRHMFPLRSLLQSGVTVAAASDAPVTTVNPFLGLAQALRRRTADGQSAGDAETITLVEALRAYTLGAAFAANEEDAKGSLSPEKLADFVVVDRDLEAVSAEEIAEAVALLTVVDGEVVAGQL